MKCSKSALLVILALACTPLSVHANGGGGIEFLSNVGPDMVGSALFSKGILLNAETGSASAFSAYGFWTSPGGWKIGGFALGFYAVDLQLAVPYTDMTILDAFGGFGGVLSGGMGRLGPFRFSLNTRLGAGILGAQTQWSQSEYPGLQGTFSLYGAIDFEAGIVLIPAMLVSVFAGMEAIAPISYGFIGLFAVPAAGVRIAWGRF